MVQVIHTSIFKCAINRDLAVIVKKIIITGLGMGCGMPEATKWGACRAGAGAQIPPLSQASSKAGLHLPRLSTRREGIRWPREETNRPADSSN